MSNTIQANGGQPQKPVRFAPIFTPRFFQGLWTQRSPLRDAGSTRLEEKYYGARGDAMIGGLNAEISPRLTPTRRPGNSQYNSQSFNSIDRFYEWRLFNATTESIKVLADTSTNLYDATGASTKTSLWTKSAGAGQTFAQSIGNSLYFGNGVDQKKVLQSLTTWSATTAYGPFMSMFLLDTNGNIQQLTNCIVHITNVSIASDVVTVTCSETLTSVLEKGLEITPSGLSTATYLNNQTLTVLTVGTHTFTASFNHANASTADTGVGLVIQGGNPFSGGSQPTWATTLMATTDDGSARWTNRGSNTMNWGIAPPDGVLTTSLTGNSGSWVTNTYYSPDGLIIDSNGNLQQVTTPGLSGSSTPSWATSVSGTTTDGSVVWTCLQTSLAWVANHAYDPTTPTYITATAGGVSCLFKLVRGPGINFVADGSHPGLPVQLDYITPTVSGGTIFGNSGDSSFGGFQSTFGVSAAQTYHITSLLYNPTIGSSTETWPAPFMTLNGAGEVTGSTTPITSQRQEKYELAFSGGFTIPTAGNYSFTVDHDDGFFFGIDGGATLISGPKTNPFAQGHTAMKNYPVLGANNVSGHNTETYVVNFPTAGNYNFEFDYSAWENEYTFKVTIGANIVPPPFISATTAPIWPAWTTSGAPSKPSVYDARYNNALDFVKPSSTCLQWVNQGPVSGMTWRAKTRFAAGGGIVDSNGNGQNVFQSGVSGATAPSWKTGTNNLTADAPTLTWICTGTAPASPAGTLSTYLGGWEYTIALVNSLDDTVSNCGPVSASTGNFNGATGVSLPPGAGLPAVIDSQADYVAIFRPVDGGVTPFLIPGVDNCLIATLTLAQYQANGYTDTTLDTGLNNLLEAPILQENTVPPVGAINLTLHLNRIFFSVGNTVYWTSGADSPIGNGFNGYSPENVAVFPSKVIRIVPTATGALVFTVSDIGIVRGDANTSPLLPDIWAQGIGLLSYNALDINGTIIYLFTSDRQVCRLDIGASGGDHVGFAISDQFRASNWDPSNAYVTWHDDGDDVGLFIADGTGTWFRMLPTPSPETGITWCPMASIVGGCKAVQSVEVSPGVHKLLVGPVGTGTILKRDLTNFTDNGTAYPWNFTIGSIVLAQGGQIAEVSHISTICRALGSKPIIGVLLDEALPYYTGPFNYLTYSTNEPPNLPESKSFYRQRFYFSQTDQTAVCQDIQINFSWPAENAANELLAMTLFGAFLQEE